MKRIVLAVLPAAVLAAVAFAALYRLGPHAAPTDLASVRSAVRWAWIAAAFGCFAQLALVGAAAPAFDPEPRSLRAGLRASIAGFARGVLPVGATLVAVLAGGLALALPGAILFVLFSLAAASPAPTVSGALLDSAARVRARPLPVLAVVATMLLVNLGIVGLLLHHGVWLARKPTPAQLATYQFLFRDTVSTIAIASPLLAALLARVGRRGGVRSAVPALEVAADAAEIDGPRADLVEAEALEDGAGAAERGRGP